MSYIEDKQFLEKTCPRCGWKYGHPMTDVYAEYPTDCPRCDDKDGVKVVMTNGEIVTHE